MAKRFRLRSLLRRIGSKLVTLSRRGGLPPDAIQKHLGSLRDIFLVDVGAHQGEFFRVLDRSMGVRCGLLAELQPNHAKQLERHFKRDSVFVLNAAVANIEGETEVEVNNFDATTSILKTMRDIVELERLDVSVKSKIRCKTITLDTAMMHFSSQDTIDLIKIDVQGAEHLVIQGARKTLARTKFVWTEVSFRPLYEGSSTFSEIYNLMRAEGFALMEIEPGFRSPNCELLQADCLFANSKI